MKNTLMCIAGGSLIGILLAIAIFLWIAEPDCFTDSCVGCIDNCLEVAE